MFIRLLEPITLQDHDKKILGEVLRLLDGIALAANEQEDRPPIGSAKLSQRFAFLLFIRIGVRRGKNQAPPRGSEHARFGYDPRHRFQFHYGISGSFSVFYKPKRQNAQRLTCRASAGGGRRPEVFHRNALPIGMSHPCYNVSKIN